LIQSRRRLPFLRIRSHIFYPVAQNSIGPPSFPRMIRTIQDQTYHPGQCFWLGKTVTYPRSAPQHALAGNRRHPRAALAGMSPRNPSHEGNRSLRTEALRQYVRPLRLVYYCSLYDVNSVLLEARNPKAPWSARRSNTLLSVLEGMVDEDMVDGDDEWCQPFRGLRGCPLETFARANALPDPRHLLCKWVVGGA